MKLHEVVGDKGRLSRAAIGPQRRKVAVPVRSEDDRLAIDHGVIDGQGADSLGDPQKRVAVIGRVSRPEDDAAGILAGDQPIAVEFNLVDPLRARSRDCCEQRTGRGDEPSRRRAPGTRRGDTPQHFRAYRGRVAESESPRRRLE
jgi:hypothetical protein